MKHTRASGSRAETQKERSKRSAPCNPNGGAAKRAKAEPAKTASAAARARVFTEQDFQGVNYEEANFTREQFEDYKAEFVGKPVPEQTVSTEKLLALGYELPEPWIQRCLEGPMPNWL